MLCGAKGFVVTLMGSVAGRARSKISSCLRWVVRRAVRPYVWLVVVAALTLLHLWGNGWLWLVELASSLPFQYATFSLGLGVISLLKKQYLCCAIALTLSFVNLHTLTVGRADRRMPVSGDSIDVYAANLFRTNCSLDRLIHSVRQECPDVAFFCEVTPKHLKELRSLKDLFPYKTEHALESHEGFVFFSRWPIVSSRILMEADHGGRPILASRLSIEDRSLLVYGLHPHAPSRPDRFCKRNCQLAWLSEHVADESDPVVVLGDLNITPFSPVYRDFLARSGLKAAREGQGWHPSWPALVPLLWVPIDHVLISPDLGVNQFRRGPFIWSDHYPVIASLSFEEA